MKTLADIEDIIQRNKDELTEKYGLVRIGVFGSYAVGQPDENSDIDLLVEVKRPMGFVKFLRLENKFSRLLWARVEMVTKNALNQHIGRRILREVKYV